jgi:hypothetical protein
MKFPARTTTVYAVPLRRWGIIQFVETEKQLSDCSTPFRSTVARDPLTGFPPSKTGACHETMSDLFPLTTDTAVGASGTVTGVTELEGAEFTLVPLAFTATAVKT